MKNRIVPCLGLLTILQLMGCGPLDREPLKTMNDLAIAAKKLGETLAKIHDASSAEALTRELDARYGTAVDLMKRMPELARKYKTTQVSKDAVDKIMKDLNDAMARITTEGARLNGMRGLPLKFWKVIQYRSLELGLVAVEAASLGRNFVSAEEKEALLKVRDLFDCHGYEQVVTVEFANLSDMLVQNAFNRLKRLAPDATLVPTKEQSMTGAIMGPIKDFHAFAAGIDFGTVTEDEPRRMIKVAVDTGKLLMGKHSPSPDSAPAEPAANADPVASAEQDRAAEEPRQRAAEEVRAKLQEKIAARRAAQKKQENGDPNDPDYFETMAERMTSSDALQRGKAIDAMLMADPATVPSAATRKKITRNFRANVEDGTSWEREKAIRGLAQWAGKYSIPILLKLLAAKPATNEELIITLLGELQDERAAPALTARLGDMRFHDAAFNALNEMGSAAEDALLEVAPSRDRKICLAALTLLGNVGTEKSLATMQNASGSRYPDVQAAGTAALQKIKQRIGRAKVGAGVETFRQLFSV